MQYQAWSGGQLGETTDALPLLDKRVIPLPWWYDGYEKAPTVNCSTPQPSLSDIGCDPDDLKSDHQCNPQGYGTVTLLYFWLAGIFSMGLCGTASMASGKVSRREYEATTDWSRVN